MHAGTPVNPSGIPGYLRAVEQERQALLARLAQVPGRSLRSRQRCFEHLVRVKLQVLAQPQRRWTLAEMASESSYSPWHFQCAFTTLFRRSPHRFVEDERLRLGLRMLAKRHLSIADIALAVGYDCCGNFSRLIKRRRGVTATMLRRQASPGGVGANPGC